MQPAYRYRATVRNVVDGDTFDAAVDLGFHVRAEVRFRMAGVNAPELHGSTREAGEAAKAWLASRIGAREVILDTTRGQEKYGRWLATVYVDGGESVNQRMVEEGLAVPFMDRR